MKTAIVTGADRGMWTCPDCKREFKTLNQWHSCVRVLINSHFLGKSKNIRKLYDKLIIEVKKFGPVKIKAVKTAINLGTTSHFSMLYIQQSGIIVTFSLPRILNSDRIQKKQKVTATLYEHWVKVGESKEIDKQLLGWLKEAYSQQFD